MESNVNSRNEGSLSDVTEVKWHLLLVSNVELTDIFAYLLNCSKTGLGISKVQINEIKRDTRETMKNE